MTHRRVSYALGNQSGGRLQKKFLLVGGKDASLVDKIAGSARTRDENISHGGDP